MPGEANIQHQSSRIHRELKLQQAIATSQEARHEPSYYDISMLKAPVWKWEIASYFFLGGLSAGTYILSRMAERFGGRQFEDLTQAGSAIAAASALACPPLLIHDLGDPKRFHHMLRVWKPSSPMNLGTWVLTAYSGNLMIPTVRDLLNRRNARTRTERRAISLLKNPTILAVSDAAGIPLAILMAGYTGVLLSSTSTPAWCKNPWIGPLFSASAIATAASALSLVLDLTDKRDVTPSKSALSKIETVAHLAEAISLVGYLKSAGDLAKPLTHGSQRPHLVAAVTSLAAPEVFKCLPLKGTPGRLSRILASVISLLGGFSLRWGFVFAGHESANDPAAARKNSRAN